MAPEAKDRRDAPGITFVDGRAVVAGTGLEIWEIIATWQACGRNFGKLRKSYPWLTVPQLQASVSYYDLYSAEIDARLQREAHWTPEQVAKELPFSIPRNC